MLGQEHPLHIIRKNSADEITPLVVEASAFDIFQTLALTSAGRPTLLRNEVEIYSEENIGFYDRSTKTPLTKGRCAITTHRLFYVDETKETPEAWYLPLAWIVNRVIKEAGFLARSAKLRIDIATPTPPLMSSFFKLSFKDGGRDDFYTPLVAALGRRAWDEESQRSHIADRRLKEQRQFTVHDAGIAGILRRQQEAQKETSDLATAAFSDLSHLMDKAKDVVGLIERYVDMTTQKAKEKSMDGNDNANVEMDVEKLSALMLDMGITSPVTRENSGSAYYKQLAGQLSEFLQGQFQHHGSLIMSLSDIYCRFNRARGIELISPDDLYHAAELQSKLGLGFHMRKFEGGLLVLQADAHREDRVAEQLLLMAQKSHHGYITTTDISTELHTSFPLAWEYLKVAEEMGKLCRDETFEGTNFYPNLFDSFYENFSDII